MRATESTIAERVEALPLMWLADYRLVARIIEANRAKLHCDIPSLIKFWGLSILIAHAERDK